MKSPPSGEGNCLSRLSSEFDAWRTSTFRSLSHRNYRLVFTGQLVSMSGSWMQSMALNWLTFDLTQSAFMVGLVSACGLLPMTFFSIAGGALTDRVNAKKS